MSSQPPTGPIVSADGKWIWDGQQWLPAQSQSQAPAPAPSVAPSPKKRGCLRRLGCGCLVLLLVLIAVGGGGYLAYSRGLISQRKIANALGKGTGEVVVTNFSDYEVTITLTDKSSGQDFTNPGDLFGGGHPIEPNFSDHFVLVPSGTFALKFSFAAPGTNVTSTSGATPSASAPASPSPSTSECDLAMKSGDVYRFVVINTAIAVLRNKDRPTKADDLNVKTSSLCKA
jgi:hypothetical protein